MLPEIELWQSAVRVNRVCHCDVPSPGCKRRRVRRRTKNESRKTISGNETNSLQIRWKSIQMKSCTSP